jgi:glycosyltransferase involved in cell wall biosynthesis
MRIAISSARQAHYNLPANSFVRHGHSVTMYSSTPVSRFRKFDPSIRHHFIPASVMLFNALTRISTPVVLNELDSTMYDKLTALRLEECDLFLGAATSSLATGIAAQRQGGIFVLDRACPDIRYQQDMLAEEARKAGGSFKRHARWFLDRQVEEYERADLMIMPSDYSRRTLPEHIRRKAVIAPLCGRSKISPRVAKPVGSSFVVGVVGGEPLRKGYLYLLQAWKELAFPDAQLKIRSGPDYRKYKVLAKLVDEQPNVSIIPYVPDISAFYAECDVFILPSVDDGFGMALFEAMANGVPSITTHNTGASELLVGGRDAIVIDAYSVQQIKQALQTLYESPDARERFAMAGQAAVSSLMAGQTARLYDEGIERLLAAAHEKSAAAVV